jgi:ADP-ribose pyrophosphatase YjhB (NUDIX family)
MARTVWDVTLEEAIRRPAGQYHLLIARVGRHGEPPGAAVSVKGVCRDTQGRVLVCRNHRGEWELPGGRPDAGELFQDCLRRELREAVPGAWVDLVAYECTLSGPVAPRSSAEHTELAVAAADELDRLPAAYAELIEACSSRPRS